MNRRNTIKAMKAIALSAGFVLTWEQPIWVLLHKESGYDISIGVDTTLDDVKRAITGLKAIVDAIVPEDEHGQDMDYDPDEVIEGEIVV